MVAILHTKSQKRKNIDNTGKKTHRNMKKKSKRFMPKGNLEYKTHKKILKTSTKLEEDGKTSKSDEQEGGGIFRRFKQWKELRLFIKVFNSIDKATKKLEPFVSKFKIRGDMLAQVLQSRIDNVNYLMIRYQHLISYEKQQAYIKTMRDKSTTDSSLYDYYTSEMKKIQLEYDIVKGYIKEYELRKTSTDATIAKYRKELETTKQILSKKFQLKFDKALKKYEEITPRLESVYIKLKVLKATNHSILFRIRVWVSTIKIL
jgi:hypothetical protein